jgi:hypothetical protein
MISQKDCDPAEVSPNICMQRKYIFVLSGLTGLTAAATVDSENDPCSNGYSFFTNLNYYKNWIECSMRGLLETCALDLPHVRHHSWTFFSSHPT